MRLAGRRLKFKRPESKVMVAAAGSAAHLQRQAVAVPAHGMAGSPDLQDPGMHRFLETPGNEDDVSDFDVLLAGHHGFPPNTL